MIESRITLKWLLITEDEVYEGDAGLHKKWRDTPESFLWLDIEGSSPSAIKDLLASKFELDEADILDASRDRHPPRFSGQNGNLFLILKSLDSDSHSLDFTTQQLAIFSGNNYLVTRHNRKSSYIESLKSRLLSNKLKVDSSRKLIILLAQHTIKRYGEILLNLEERLDELEDELLQNPDEKLMQELLGYNTALRKMRRILNYHLNVFNSLSRHVRKQETIIENDKFEDMAIEAERFNSLAELYQNVINDLIEGYISLNSHKLNQVMRVLTVVTVLFLPLSLLVGIYGMNFENIPELKSQNGYFILLGIMGLIVSFLVIFFHKKRWL
ncbi:MAG: magnesium/cobalt transporter CorA [Gammaproteobacteria bacterium]|jgi:magnesium transporter